MLLGFVEQISRPASSKRESQEAGSRHPDNKVFILENAFPPFYFNLWTNIDIYKSFSYYRAKCVSLCGQIQTNLDFLGSKCLTIFGAGAAIL